MKKLLEGIRVLDVTQAYSGPFCSMHLADHGAEVIKVESIQGEQSRLWAPFKNGYSGYFAYINRNKKGLAVDLKTEEGKEILRRLIKESDVLVENFKVGTFARLGFSYEKIKEINSRIIYASVSGFGLKGPMAERACYDIVAQAESGMMSLCGYEDLDPIKVGPSIADSYSGTYLALGIMMALFDRERTNEGHRIDVSMLDTMFSVMEHNVMIYTMTGEVPIRHGNAGLNSPPWDSFHAKDGMFVVGCGTEKFWQSLCDVMGREDLKTDPRYATMKARSKHYIGDLKDIIENWSSNKTLDELEESFNGAEIPFGRIRNIAECTEMEQIKKRNMLWTVFDPGANDDIVMPGSPIKVKGEDDNISKAAPTIGQDNDSILRELAGYSEKEIEKMKTENIIAG
ncbi:MAG: CoA transferase [Eubacteriaceae bacterium]|jgi:CoA:oxalate CoA-transferase|nr:CoA transferase [Eubacteriaceae bacterium]